MSNNLKAKGTTSFIWNIVGKLTNSGMGFILTLILARLLEPSEFGLIAIVLVILGFISVFFDAGLSAALIQRKRVLPIHYSSVFYFNLIIASILAVSVFISAGAVANFYNNQELVGLIEVMSVSFLLGALSSVQRVQLQKELNYKVLTKITIISTVFSGGVGVFLAYDGAGVWSLVVQNLSFGVFSNILLWSISRWKPSLMFSLKALKSLWSFGFHVFLVNIMNAIFGRVDVLIAGKLVAPSVLGFYDRAKHLNQVIYSYSAGSLMSVLFPLLSKVQKDLPRFQNIFIKIYGILSFGVFLLIGGFYVISEELILLLFSVKWLATVDYFKIIMLGSFASIYGALLSNVLVSRGKSKLYFKVDILKKILLGINLYIGFLFGLEGFLYGAVLVAYLRFFIDLYCAGRELKLSLYPFIKNMFTQLIISAISVALTFTLTSTFNYNYIIMLVSKWIIFIILYMLISFIFKTESYQYSTEQLKYIFDKNKK